MRDVLKASLENWVVWSEEHGGWWMPLEYGYTPRLSEAGRFSPQRAMEIEKKANRCLPQGVINEVAMPDPWPHAHTDAGS